MLVSTPTKHFSHRSSPYNSPMSPSFTPPRRCVNMDSAMLTPSPLTSRSPFPKAFVNNDLEDLFLSPYKSPAPAHVFNPAYTTSKPQPIPSDDEEGRIFASSTSAMSFPPLFPSSSSQPLLTPVKQGGRLVLSVRHLNQQHEVAASDKPLAMRVGVGTKRKSNVHCTPLKLDTGAALQRLGPLSPPRFSAHTETPLSKVDPDTIIKKHAATLRRLRLADRADVMDTCDDFDDSGCEMDDDGAEAVLLQKDKSRNAVALNKGKDKEEVAEAISPGGHVVKRRARTRPLSAELREHPFKSPPSPSQKPHGPKARPRLSGHVTFPSATSYRGRASPGSSSSEGGSPLPRRRVNNVRPPIPQPPLFSRPPLTRDTPSAATLFFGPTIPQPNLPTPRTRTTTITTMLSKSAHEPSGNTKHTRNVSNRHSYAGSTDSFWSQLQVRPMSPSPVTKSVQNAGLDTDDEDMSFDGPAHSSFSFGDTPQPLPSKYQATSWPYGDSPTVLPSGSRPRLDSASSEDILVTPDLDTHQSLWLEPRVFGQDTQTGPGENVDVDEFIVRTLVAASKGPDPGVKKIPGTPVKKVRTAFLGPDRPWQSAATSKIGLKEDCDFRMAPRKSLPAAFGGKPGKSLLEQCSDSEGEEDSPSGRKNGKYAAASLGLGHPRAPPATMANSGPLVLPRTRWLMRRSSSGAFSNSSESTSQVSTPTRTKGMDWQLPKLQITASERSASGSSTSSGVTSSPTNHKLARQAGTAIAPAIPSIRRPRLSLQRAPNDRSENVGRFERDFETVDELGSGEFGKVIKVHSKENDAQVFAIKKSKRFEGTKHRLRLREEVDTLKHLSEAAARSGLGGRHPNVLSYIDSWEEDEALYIRTELCESGNLSRFLWEYGKMFPRLDESRVWKIIADLGNGLGFIHDAGVIHLDLKPSNVFITSDGRLKIGDFGMASVWPRPKPVKLSAEDSSEGFEREGDKLYLAPEILQGRYGKAADVFSFGMTILETASNIMVPDQGEAWHRLRQEDFSQVDWHGSEELLELIKQMMRTEPGLRPTVKQVCSHAVVSRARRSMEEAYRLAQENGTRVFDASPLAKVPAGFLEEILGSNDSMDLSG